jgi:hypothetical protein
VTVSNVEIPAPGTYHLVLWLDNVEKKTYRFRAIQTLGVPMLGGAMVQPTILPDSST